MRLFILFHVYTFDDEDDTEDVKYIGVYSSAAAAQAAIERLRHLPGFCDTPDGFEFHDYQVDQDHWTEGYVTLSPDDD